MILRLLILYFAAQWARSRKLAPKVQISDKLVVVQGADWIRPWSPVVLSSNSVRIAESTDIPDGVLVPYSIGNSVLLNGVHDFSGYQVPAPSGKWLGRSNDSEPWVWSTDQPSTVIARIFQTYIIKEENNMAYAIGGGDVSDIREYTYVQDTAFGGHPPFVGMPIKADGSSIAAASSNDEVVIGVIRAYTAQSTESYDENGNPVTTTTYDVTLQVAEGDFECSSLVGGSANAGTPLFVQSWSPSSVADVDSAYGTSEPTSGYSHALCTTVSGTKLHYNGHSRPVAI